MSGRVLAITHQRDAGAGVFAEEIARRGLALDEWHITEGADPPGELGDYGAVMTFGGAMNAHEETEHPWLVSEKALLAGLIEARVPLLGVCLGSQLVAEAAGAPATRAGEPEIGWLEVELTAEGVADPLLAPLAPSFTAFQWHSYTSPVPPGAVALARSPVCLQAFRVGTSAWGIQFHAEVSASDALRWTAEYENDPDAVRIGLDPDALARSIEERIEAWNETGRALCGRFLDLARPR